MKDILRLKKNNSFIRIVESSDTGPRSRSIGYWRIDGDMLILDYKTSKDLRTKKKTIYSSSGISIRIDTFYFHEGKIYGDKEGETYKNNFEDSALCRCKY
ncbi:MAG: hypothetical protein HY064_04630 [Bacteroidetes bacterium]|nr:hypothetical protein [Bacteroidota bacterium]